MRNKKVIIVFAVILVIAMLLSGCGGSQATDAPANNSPAPSNSETAQDAPKENPAGASKEVPQGSVSTNGKADEMGDRLAKVYTDLLQSGKYYMKYRTTYEMDEQQYEALLEVAINGEDSAIISTIDEGKSHIVLKDNKTYMIDYDSKSVLVMKTEESGADDIETDGLLYKGNGKEDFLGKNLVYEEYSTVSGSQKYFFEGKKLVGMTIHEEGETLVFEILEMSDKYPANIFTIPADFSKEEM